MGICVPEVKGSGPSEPLTSSVSGWRSTAARCQSVPVSPAPSPNSSGRSWQTSQTISAPNSTKVTTPRNSPASQCSSPMPAVNSSTTTPAIAAEIQQFLVHSARSIASCPLPFDQAPFCAASQGVVIGTSVPSMRLIVSPSCTARATLAL